MDYYYAAPSISAIAIKVLLLWLGRKSLKLANRWMWLFLLGLFGVNLSELFLFSFVDEANSQYAVITLKSYYLFALLSCVAYLGLALNISKMMDAKIELVLLSVFFLSGLITLFTNGMIQGGTSIGYSVTRVAGTYYWVIQLILCVFVLGAMGLLAFLSFGHQSNWMIRRRALALLAGSSPVAVSVLFVMGLMQFGLPVNATIIVSLATNILLAVLIYTEYEHRVFKFLSFIPATYENKMTAKAASALYGLQEGGLSGVVEGFEKAVINQTLEKCNGNKTIAAQILGISRATLRRKLSS